MPDTVTVSTEIVKLWAEATGIAYGVAARILAETPPTTKRATEKAAQQIHDAAHTYGERGYPLTAQCLLGIALGLETRGAPPAADE